MCMVWLYLLKMVLSNVAHTSFPPPLNTGIEANKLCDRWVYLISINPMKPTNKNTKANYPDNESENRTPHTPPLGIYKHLMEETTSVGVEESTPSIIYLSPSRNE